MRIRNLLILCSVLIFSFGNSVAQRTNLRLNEHQIKLLQSFSAISQLYVDPVDENKLMEDAIMGILDKSEPQPDSLDVEETKRLIANRQINVSTNERYQMLLTSFNVVSRLYDPVDEKKLVEDAIRGMLEKLDPHSDYLEPEEAKELTENLDSNFDGIGIQFNMLTDTLYVIQVISGGPSEKVGLLAGDRIILVNDTLIAGVNMRNTDIMKRLRGQRGTEVRVGVKRSGMSDLLEFKITRGRIPIYSIDATYMLDSTTGYIRLNRFALSSTEEFRQAVAKLQKQGMENLILDLQQNGGGYLHIANDLADDFLEKGKLVVYQQGNRMPKAETFATEKGLFEKGRLAMLVDEASASGSEILAGAVQDWDRGVIVGRRTFGKGLVQRPLPLPDGSMIRLTIARYFTPSGRFIQKPYTSGNDREYGRELIERLNRGELMSADSIHFPDSLKHSTLLSNRTIYGGGGIMPDVFIPIDTTRYTDFHRKINALGLIIRTAMNYIDVNRKVLNEKYPDIRSFKNNYEVSDEIIQSLLNLATEEKVEYDEEQVAKSKTRLMLHLKALIARDLFDMNEYYVIINDDNESLKEALRLINSPDEYQKILGKYP